MSILTVPTIDLGVRDVITGERIDEILDDLDMLIRRWRLSTGEIERDWDGADFARFARSLPELDDARTDDPEGEIWLLDGTRLFFDRTGPCWEADESGAVL